MEVSKYNNTRHMNMPIWGNAADVPLGAYLKKGTTPATNNGALIAATGDSEHLDIVGILGELLDYSVDTETLVNGTTFVTKPVDFEVGHRIITVEFSTAAADLIATTSNVTSTTITLTSLENDIDAAFLYVVSGTGAGQLQYLTASAAGSATLKASFGTSLDSTSRLIKIVPRFHTLLSLNSDGTKLSNQAAAGSMESHIVLDTRMAANDSDNSLSPVSDPGRTGLNNARGLRFLAEIVLRDTASYSLG